MRFLLKSLSLMAMAILIAGSANAASQCKGLEKPACETNDRCSWVRSYTTKKGTTVSAFCRSKPGQKESSKAADKSKQS